MKKKALIILASLVAILAITYFSVRNAMIDEVKKESVLLKYGTEIEKNEERQPEDYEFPEIPATEGDSITVTYKKVDGEFVEIKE